jgi:5'-methylthioadenosine nucleosidase
VTSVAVVMAMRSEAAPLVASLRLREVADGPEGLPFRWYDGEHHGVLVTVATNGVDSRHGVDNIGTNPAVLNTWLTIEQYRPDVVVTAGTAGGFAARGAVVGDVYLSEGDFVFHDRRIAVPGFTEYGFGRYPSTDVTGLAGRLGAKTGVVSTGNSLDGTEVDLQLMAANNASVKEMEAAAVAWVCWLSDTPVFAVKAVTDLVDGPADTAEEFLQNLTMATGRLAATMVELIALLGESGWPPE